MKQTIYPLSLMAITSLAILGQPAPGPVAFEVASVKPAAPSLDGNVRRSFNGDAGRIDYSNVTLKMLLMRAYRLKDYQITGPDWLSSEGYNVVATLPHDASAAQLPEMLQTLLAERFKLTVHHEPKELPVYALVVGKAGPKLKPAEQETGFKMMAGPKGRHLEGQAQIGALCDALSRNLDRPVVDMTGLQGAYEISLDWAPEDGERGGTEVTMMVTAGAGGAPPAAPAKRIASMPDNTGGVTLFTALQERLGLKLEQRKAPADTLVVDNAEKIPIEN